MLLYGDDAACLGSGLPDSLLVKGLQPRAVEHTGRNTLLFQLQTCLPGVVDGLTSGYDGDIGTVQELNGLADLKREVVVLVDIRYGSTSHTDIARLVEVDQELHQLFGDTPVGRQTNGHAREGAQHGNVVQRMVGGT